MPGRTLRHLTLVLAVAALSLPAVDARAAKKASSDETALTVATRDWKALSADLRRRQLRDRWDKVIGRIEKIGRSKAAVSVRALALMRAGGATEEMSTISHRRKDVLRAEGLYLDAAKLKTGISGEALAAAALIEQERLGQPDKARATRARAKGLARNEPSTARPPRNESNEPAVLQAATDAWKRLEDDGSRRKLREPWLAVVARLEAAGEALAPEQAGALGYFRAAQAAEKLYAESRLKADLRRAISLYETLAARCPKSTLADDALVAAAAHARKTLRDPESARRLLTQAVALGGDRAADARAQLAALPPAPKEPEDPETPLQIVAALEAHADRNQDVEAPGPLVHNATAPELKRLHRTVMADTSVSLSEQAGLKVHRIIVDAGHGGHDFGATGPTGVHEKDVTLAIATKLASSLKTRGFEVVLTREEDAYVALEERTSIANKERGDLFISIHANAHPSRKQAGVETYALNVSSNRFAMRLAARENATSTRSISDLQYLIADLATRANTVDSARLAEYVQRSIISGASKVAARPKDHGVKQALFFVLLGTRMPAVLVETAFISNPAEEKRLASAAYQSVLAESIAKGVDQFVARRQQLASSER
jgi:N-acetylmuramoyl-L-alanine amidase